MTFRFRILLYAWLSAFQVCAQWTFSRLDASDGLSDNQVQHILQLPDGRMAITTKGNINLYDGMRFHYIHRNDSDEYTLDGYHGAYHVYADNGDRLWVKDWKTLWCLDLRGERYLKRPERLFREMGLNERVTDLFVDSERGLWLVTDKGLWEARNRRWLLLSPGSGELQDVERYSDALYLFFSTGEVACYGYKELTLLYKASAYAEDVKDDYARTSLVVKGPDGNFYQLRTGPVYSGFFAFNPQTRKWRQLMRYRGVLHTLIVPSREAAYISCKDGIWKIALPGGEKTFRSQVELTDGSVQAGDINTIYQDGQRGIWLGTYKKGICYAHPERSPFLSVRDGALLPIAAADIPATLAEPVRRKLFRGKWYNDVFTDSRGWTWTATSDGLRLFVPGNDKPRIFYTEDGLSNNSVHAIVEDRRQRIWVSTSNGISRLQPQVGTGDIRFVNYRSQDGTLKGEYSDGAAALLPDGKILMRGVDGWTCFHPDSVGVPFMGFSPLPVGFSLHGNPVPVFPGNRAALLPEASPYVRCYQLAYHQNSVGIDFSALNYAWPTHTYYRYRLLHGKDSAWHIAAPDVPGGLVDANGNLHLSFALLPPGNYRLQVAASTSPERWEAEATEVVLEVHAPWWRTKTAYAIYFFGGFLLLIGSIYLYMRQARLRLLRQHKEEILLLRIRNLIAQCDSYRKQTEVENVEATEAESASLSATDSEFLSRAVALVEAHLDDSGYSVEQLSKDLCMERTGLYKKLTSLLSKSPSLFIRSIRLKRAAHLITQGNLSITEVAERVGFSSASYMSKCFQEEYGCTPSAYARRGKTEQTR